MKVGLWSAIGLIIANMIGAGIFTSTGFQAEALGHPGHIFMLWILGGLLALAGALCYAELGAMMPEDGGEYVYLRETFGGYVAFMSAFVSLVAGFSAPIASAAKSLARYLSHFSPVFDRDPILFAQIHVNDVVAIGVVWTLVLVHRGGVRPGVTFNNVITLAKVIGIVLLILAAAIIGKGQLSNLTHVAQDYGSSESLDRLSAFATSLIFVMFCYSGWNASAYIAGEMDRPQRNLPRSLIAGTGIVMLLYLLLNIVYLYGADVETLAGKAEVGLIAARGLFGPTGVTLVTVLILISLFASASAMTLAGPRVYYALGRDVKILRFLSSRNESTGSPTNSLLTQGIVTSIIIVSGRIDQIQQYAGMTLVFFSSLSVASLIVLRVRRPDAHRPFRTWGYPFTPIAFLAICSWMMIWNFGARPIESILAFFTVVAGGCIYYVLKRAEVSSQV